MFLVHPSSYYRMCSVTIECVLLLDAFEEGLARGAKVDVFLVHSRALVRELGVAQVDPH